MTLRIDRTRMAMDGRFYSYDGRVPLEQVGHGDAIRCVEIVDGKRYVSYAAATQPEWIRAMTPSTDRYRAACAHEKKAKAELLAFAQSVYPELAGLDAWPALWLELEIEERHDTRFVELEAL